MLAAIFNAVMAWWRIASKGPGGSAWAQVMLRRKPQPLVLFSGWLAKHAGARQKPCCGLVAALDSAAAIRSERPLADVKALTGYGSAWGLRARCRRDHANTMGSGPTS
jgi:hypothetical protein